MPKKYRLDKVLKNNLSENEKDKEKTQYEKDKDVEEKDIEDVEKDDLDDEENEIEDEEVAVSITMNAKSDGGGKIKLVPFKNLTNLMTIENILSLFKIDPSQSDKDFENKIELTIRSPLTDFKDEKYVIRLMNGTGEITVNKSNLNQTFSKKSKALNTNLQQAINQQVGQDQTQQEPEEEKNKVDLSYLPDLNYDFQKSVKREFFDRITAFKNA